MGKVPPTRDNGMQDLGMDWERSNSRVVLCMRVTFQTETNMAMEKWFTHHQTSMRGNSPTTRRVA